MSDNGSQKLDIEDICDAVVGSIDGNVSDILTAATSSNFTTQQLTALSIARETLSAMNEMVFHLRIITGETPSEQDVEK